MSTRVTQKFQTTIPEKARQFLGVGAGDEVEWHVVRGMVVVDTIRKIRNPVKFLTSQIKLDLDAVRLVKEARAEFG